MLGNAHAFFLTFFLQFKDHSKSVVFPKPDDSLTTHNILVEAYESGSPISSHFGSSSSEKKALARPLITAFLRMVFTHSFIHCDLHPGNVLVKDDGRLVILDAGIVSELEVRQKLRGADAFCCCNSNLVDGDGNEILLASLVASLVAGGRQEKFEGPFQGRRFQQGGGGGSDDRR